MTIAWLSFLAAFFRDVVSCIVHSAGNIGATIERFLAEHEFEFTLDQSRLLRKGAAAASADRKP